jgi:hypothetical protein
MWAGVQKLSRPMERCQETSHAPPIEAEVTARTPVQMYQGTELASERTCVVDAAGALKVAGWAVEVDMRKPLDRSLGWVRRYGTPVGWGIWAKKCNLGDAE